MTPKELFQRIRHIEIKTSHLVENFLQGKYRSVFKGQGMEFDEVRPYQTGDDLRIIDWNVTARTGQPYVKIFQEEREITVILAIDISRSLHYGTGARLKKDLIAEVAAILAFSAIKNHDKVGLLLFTQGIEQYLSPKKEVRHVLRMIRDLLAFQPKGEGTDLNRALTFLGSVLPKKAVIFLFSDFIFPQDYWNPLKVVAKHHDFIAVNVIDPRELELPELGVISVSDLETGKQILVDTSPEEVRTAFSNQCLERRAKLKTMMGKLRSGYVELFTDRSYLPILQKFFTLRQRRS